MTKCLALRTQITEKVEISRRKDGSSNYLHLHHSPEEKLNDLSPKQVSQRSSHFSEKKMFQTTRFLNYIRFLIKSQLIYEQYAFVLQ